MLILYVLLIAYIVSINFYGFLLVKTLRDKQRQSELESQAELYSAGKAVGTSSKPSQDTKPPEKYIGKLLITGLLGGAIAIYASMFAFKYKRTELLLMVLMPLLAVLNIYMWVLLFKSGFGFLLIR